MTELLALNLSLAMASTANPCNPVVRKLKRHHRRYEWRRERSTVERGFSLHKTIILETAPQLSDEEAGELST